LARAEYRYADFGSAPFNATRSSPFPSRNPTVDNFDVTLRTHTATFGLAYKFGDPIASSDAGGTRVPFATMPSPAMVSWSGPYAGFGLGAHASRADVTTTSLLLGGTQQSLTDSATSEPLDGLAFRSSLFAGFNWQFTQRWVAGVESDVGYAGQKTILGGLSFAPLPTTAQGVGVDLSGRITWDAGLRARLGVLVTPSTLIYVSGGAAWQHFEVTSTCASSDCATFGFSPATVANSATKAGWTVGGGLETALWGTWLGRAEYRYADFGSSSFTISRSSTFANLNPTVDNFDINLRTHTVTFGLAYKFN
jgi:outer membrane immunogenic protein